jgi:predicted nucleic acid-binding protein
MESLEVLKGRRVYLDSNVVIYILAESTPFSAIAQALLGLSVGRECEFVTAEIAVSEVLPGVVRDDDLEAVDRCLTFFESGDVIELQSTSRDAFYKAGLLRGRTRLSTPDAIHLMTAVETGCEVFLTNDRRIPPLKEISVVQLSDLSG